MVCEYLEDLLSNYKGAKVALHWDNCSTHISKVTREWLETNHPSVETIMNIPYTPEFMSVEFIWAKMKIEFRKLLTTIKLKNHDRFDGMQILK